MAVRKTGDLNTTKPTTGFTLIQRIFVTTPAAAVTFSSIPSGYNHYYMIIVGRTDRVGFVNDYLSLRFNNNSVADYKFSTVTSTYAGYWTVPGATAFPAPHMATAAVNLFNAGNSTHFTYIDTQRGNYVSNTIYTAATSTQNSYGFALTDRVTTISVFSQNGANIVSPSYVELWGIP